MTRARLLAGPPMLAQRAAKVNAPFEAMHAAWTILHFRPCWQQGKGCVRV